MNLTFWAIIHLILTRIYSVGKSTKKNMPFVHAFVEGITCDYWKEILFENCCLFNHYNGKTTCVVYLSRSFIEEEYNKSETVYCLAISANQFIIILKRRFTLKNFLTAKFHSVKDKIAIFLFYFSR